MHHERQLYGVGCLAGEAQRRHIVIARHAARQANFHSQDHVAVLLDRADREFRIGVAQIHQFAPRVVVGKGRLADHGNIEQREDASIDGINHQAPESGEGVRARRTGVQYGGGAFRDAVGIGWDGERRNAVINVDVNVDQSRGNDLAARVHDDARIGLRNGGSDRRHFVPRNRNVAHRGERLRGIDHLSALDQQIVLGRGSRCLGRCGRSQAGEQREKFTSTGRDHNPSVVSTKCLDNSFLGFLAGLDHSRQDEGFGFFVPVPQEFLNSNGVAASLFRE